MGTDANRVPAVLDNREAVSALGLGYSRHDVLPERAGDSPEVTSARRQEVAQLERLVGLTGAKLHLVSHESGARELPAHIYLDVNNNGAATPQSTKYVEMYYGPAAAWHAQGARQDGPR